MAQAPLLATPLRQLAQQLESGTRTGEALVEAAIDAANPDFS